MDVTFEGNSTIGKNEWLTSPELLSKLGTFDLDPCAPVKDRGQLQPTTTRPKMMD